MIMHEGRCLLEDGREGVAKRRDSSKYPWAVSLGNTTLCFVTDKGISQEEIAGFDIIKMLEPGWQDISSAPRDGSHVLLYRNHIQFIGHYSRGGWYINAPGLVPMTPHPTHWMPVPKKPTVENLEAGGMFTGTISLQKPLLQVGAHKTLAVDIHGVQITVTNQTDFEYKVHSMLEHIEPLVFDQSNLYRWATCFGIRLYKDGAQFSKMWMQFETEPTWVISVGDDDYGYINCTGRSAPILFHEPKLPEDNFQDTLTFVEENHG